MAKQQYGRALAVITYSRKLKRIRPLQVRNMRVKGKTVKVMLDKDGRRLRILDAPKDVLTLIKRAEDVRVVDGTLRIVERKKLKTEPELPPIKPKPMPKPAPKPEPILEPPKIEEKPPQPKAKVEDKPYRLTPEEREKASFVPVPDKGIIPTPYIDWEKIPESCKVSDVLYYDYPMPQAPKGMIHELREMFRRSRRYQHKAPVNVLILGPKGSGKSELVKKFAEESGLPYWQVIGREGISSDELLGYWELKEGTSKWVDGIIPKAVRAGGILHIDEANVIEPAILMRLNELLNSKRQLNLEELNGEIIKAHPDLFIIFSINPPTFEGVKDLPEPVKSRLTKRYYLSYPPLEHELNILKKKLKLTDDEFRVDKHGTAEGRYAKDIMDLMQIIGNLRLQQDLSYTPSIRETQAFIQDLKEGDDFHTAFDRNVKGIYYGEEADRVEEALRSVRPR